MGKKYKINEIKNRKINSEVERTKLLIKRYEVWEKYLKSILENPNKKSSINYDELYYLQGNLEYKKESLIDQKLKFLGLRMGYGYEDDIKRDDRYFDIANVLDGVIDFFVQNTSMKRDEIEGIIDQRLVEVVIFDEFEDNKYGIGYFSSDFGELAVKSNEINGELADLLKHELTHVLGTKIKRRVEISGYQKKDLNLRDEGNLEITEVSSNPLIKYIRNMFGKQNVGKQNTQFNEALVEMFASKGKEYKEYNMNSLIGIDMKLYSNLKRGSCYIYNSNLVRQMLIARGIDEEEAFTGLFDEKCANNTVKKFKSKIFKKISKKMDEIFQNLENYMDISDEIYDKYYEESDNEFDHREKCSKEELEKENIAKHKFMQGISNTEKIIIDEILLPRIKKMKNAEREKVLQDYSKFIINEKKYFTQVTGFEFITQTEENEKQEFIENLKFRDDNDLSQNQKENQRKCENKKEKDNMQI